MKIRDYCPRCGVIFPNEAWEPGSAVKWRKILGKCAACNHSLGPLPLEEQGPGDVSRMAHEGVGKEARSLFKALVHDDFMPEIRTRKVDWGPLLFIDCMKCPSGSWKDWEVPYSFDTVLRNEQAGFVVASGTNAAVAFVAANEILRLFHPHHVHTFVPEHAVERFRKTLEELGVSPERYRLHVAGTNGQQTAGAAIDFAEKNRLPMVSGWAPWGRRYGLWELWRCILAGLYKRIDYETPIAYFQGVAGALGVWALTKITREGGLPWTPFLCMPAGSAPFAAPRNIFRPDVVGGKPFNPVVVGEQCFDVGPNPVAPVLDSKTTNEEQGRWHARGNYPCVCLHNEEILESWRELRELFPEVGLEAGTAYAGYKKTVKEQPEMLGSKLVVINLSGRARPGDEELA